jgi:hypothetical protein
VRRTIMSLVALFLTSTVALGESIVNVGSHFFAPGEVRTIALSVTSDNAQQIMGLNFYIQIGDGGEANLGVDTVPIITNVDVTGPGTIFEMDHEDPYIFPDEQLMWGANVATVSYVDPDDPDKVVAGTVPCNGVFAYVTIDATGATPGQTYSLKLTEVADIVLEGGYNTCFVTADANELGSFVNGSITIIPEPSAIGLLCSTMAAISVAGLRCRFVSAA